MLGREPAAETSRSTVPGRNPLPLTVCTGSKHCGCQVRLSGGGRSDAAGQPYRPCRSLVGLFISALLTLAEVKIPTRPDVSGCPQDNRGFRPSTVDHRFSGGSSPRTTRCEICASRYFFSFFKATVGGVTDYRSSLGLNCRLKCSRVFRFIPSGSIPHFWGRLCN